MLDTGVEFPDLVVIRPQDFVSNYLIHTPQEKETP
jgi:hypothetical protein